MEYGKVIFAGWLEIHLDIAIDFIKKNGWTRDQVKIVKKYIPEFNDTMVLIKWKERL